MIEIFPDEVKNDDFAPAQEVQPERKAEMYPIKLRHLQCSGFEAKQNSTPVLQSAVHENKKKHIRRRSNVLMKYISRLYAICLINLFAAVAMLIWYRSTGNELLVPAIYACAANGLLTYMCV